MLAKKCKKLVAMLLTLSLVLGLLGTAALANGTETSGGGSAPGAVTEKGVTVDKSATELDANDETTVSLSVGATEGKENVAVMFLLDKSTSQGMRDEAAAMLDELKTKTNTNILYDVVIFSGTATATGWKNIQNDADLNATKTNFVRAEATSGTNMTAGIQKAQSELATLPEGYDTTYLVTLSDGITYVWDENGQTYCVPVAGLNADGTGVEDKSQTGTDTWAMMYEYGTSMTEVYGSFEKFLTAAPNKLQATREAGYLTAWNSGDPKVEKYIETYVYDNEETAKVAAKYACGIDFAVYNSAVEYVALAHQFDKSFAYAVPELDDSGADNTTNWANYPWGKELMDYCQSQSTNANEGAISNTDAEKIFSDIKNAILYSIQSGTVTDVIGDSFDLTSVDTITLTVGGEALTGVADTANKNLINFGTAEEGVYPYTVEYKPAAGEEPEQLVWTINVPVENDKGVSLSYDLKLVNKESAAGSYTVPTNESAVLDYTSTEGTKDDVTFPEPQLTYTVENTQPDPDPDPEQPAPEWEISKSKTATNLDANYESQVTLSLPAAGYERTMDVVLVIDDTHAGSDIFEEAANSLLDELAAKTTMDIKVGVVAFDAVSRDWLSATSNSAYSGLVSIKDADALTALKKAVSTQLDYNGEGYMKKVGATNTEWAVDMASDMLSTGTGEDKYLIMFSDLYGYIYRGDLTIDGTTYSNVPVSKRIGTWNQGSMSMGIKYDTFADAYAHRNDADNQTVDGFFRDSSWDSYWSTYGNVTSVPENTIATDYQVASHTFSGFEKSLCLTYDNLVEAAAQAKVIIVNNSFPIGDALSAQPMVQEALDALENGGYVKTYRYQTASADAALTGDAASNVFTGIREDLIQLVDAGSKVVDVIGSGSDYNFDFVNSIDKLTLTVGGDALEKVKIDDTTYGFGPITDEESEATTYSYVLHYYADGATNEQTGGNGTVESECFVWDINVPVTKDAPVQLTYSVKLPDPKTAPGTYGQYDADGSKEYDGLYTNNSAVLYPVDSLGNEGTAEAFSKPTVSYTVSGGGGGDISYNYYTVTVNYLDKDTGEKVAASYTSPSRIQGSRYDVTEYDAIAINGYTYDSTSGDALTGTLNSNKVVNVYYVAGESDIPDDDTPTGDLPDLPDDPGETDIPDDDTPTGDLPDLPDDSGETDIPDGDVPTGDLPQTGTTVDGTMNTIGMLLLAMSMATAGTAGIILLKRKEN